MGLWTFCRFKKGAWQERGGGVFEGRGGVDTSMYTMQKLTNNNKRFQTVFVQFLLPFIGSKLETTYTIVASYKGTKSVSKHSFNVV